jgi:hypothetical protein
VNRSVAVADLVGWRATIPGRRALINLLQKRIAVVGNGYFDVGNKNPTRKPGQIGLAGSDAASEPGPGKPNPLKTERPRTCRAMLQQCADSGSFPAPQKFVRLVGCRDSKLRPGPSIRPRPSQAE